MSKLSTAIKALANKATARLNASGAEVLDPTPVAIPVGYTRPPTLAESIARILSHHETQKKINAAGFESFEEAHDFDDPNDTYGDDWDNSPWEEGYEGEFDHEIELERQHFEEDGDRQDKKRKFYQRKRKQEKPAEQSSAAKPSEKAPSGDTSKEEKV